MTGRLQGRRIVITGAAGGLGPVAANAALADGARLVLADVSETKIAALAESLAADEGAVSHVAVDLLDTAATAAFAEAVTSAGPVDGVWHLVGGWRGGTPFEEQPLADWDFLHDLAVRTTYNVARAFTLSLLAAPAGRFLSVSSPQATRPTSDNAAYAAMKAGSDAVVLALADRLAGSSATANIVTVTAILTPAMRAKDPDRPRPGFVRAEDISQALIWITGDTARTMNGQRLRLTPVGS